MSEDKPDRPRVKYVRPEEKDPWEMKAKRKPGIVVKERALKFSERGN